MDIIVILVSILVIVQVVMLCYVYIMDAELIHTRSFVADLTERLSLLEEAEDVRLLTEEMVVERGLGREVETQLMDNDFFFDGEVR